MIKEILVFMAFFAVANVQAATVCQNQQEVEEAALNKFSANSDPAITQDAAYEKTVNGLDLWTVSVVHNDICYVDVVVSMKAGTCTVVKVKAGHETCTDD